eukprot:365003-Chlamydomonas_euryale.AAC.1
MAFQHTGMSPPQPIPTRHSSCYLRAADGLAASVQEGLKVLDRLAGDERRAQLLQRRRTRHGDQLLRVERHADAAVRERRCAVGRCAVPTDWRGAFREEVCVASIHMSIAMRTGRGTEAPAVLTAVGGGAPAAPPGCGGGSGSAGTAGARAAVALQPSTQLVHACRSLFGGAAAVAAAVAVAFAAAVAAC